MSSSTGAPTPSPSPPVALPLLINSLRTRRRYWAALIAGLLAVVTAYMSVYNRSAGTITGAAWEVLRESGTRLSEEGDWPSLPSLGELEDRGRLWPPDLNKPICTPKIYVYDLPPHLRLPEATVSQCRWSAYNSELLLHKLLTDPPASSPAPASHPHLTLVTSNPSEADFFFVPLFPACYLFDCWVKADWKKTERCGVDEAYIQPVMQHVREALPYWNASGGADHLVSHPMDYADGYYTETSRVAMNASTYLVTVSDLRPAPYGQYTRFHQDLVIPSSTHLLNSYYVNPMDYLDGKGRPLAKSELRGAQRLHRKIDLPPASPEIFQPSPEPPLQHFLPPIRAFLRRILGSPLQVDQRTTLAIFRGGVGEPTNGEAYALRIRSLFFPSTGNPSLPPYSSHRHPGFSSLPDFDIAEKSENIDYALRLSRSKFGLAPPGYTLDTTRLYEYLAFGVVPVFIGTGPTAGQVLPFSQDVDWSSFTVSIPRERAHETPRILREMSEEEYERKRRMVWEVGRKVVLEGREGNVWTLLTRQLCRRKRIGLSPGAEIANN